jgi:hypothetical protein
MVSLHTKGGAHVDVRHQREDCRPGASRRVPARGLTVASTPCAGGAPSGSLRWILASLRAPTNVPIRDRKDIERCSMHFIPTCSVPRSVSVMHGSAPTSSVRGTSASLAADTGSAPDNGTPECRRVRVADGVRDAVRYTSGCRRGPPGRRVRCDQAPMTRADSKRAKVCSTSPGTTSILRVAGRCSTTRTNASYISPTGSACGERSTSAAAS